MSAFAGDHIAQHAVGKPEKIDVLAIGKSVGGSDDRGEAGTLPLAVTVLLRTKRPLGEKWPNSLISLVGVTGFEPATSTSRK
jgi:hypothetical protein